MYHRGAPWLLTTQCGFNLSVRALFDPSFLVQLDWFSNYHISSIVAVHTPGLGFRANLNLHASCPKFNLAHGHLYDGVLHTSGLGVYTVHARLRAVVDALVFSVIGHLPIRARERVYIRHCGLLVHTFTCVFLMHVGLGRVSVHIY